VVLALSFLGCSPKIATVSFNTLSATEETPIRVFLFGLKNTPPPAMYVAETPTGEYLAATPRPIKTAAAFYVSRGIIAVHKAPVCEKCP